ncbi:Oidioi.mRNA.OKI2018_I69.PAR.g8864.t2.cds [Oikopleura dioica]|uniref:Oidioi.mRNA.OKI2018_I69.PAR.g8864.t2.cds n=1 Tax=Oikopleura dioica TaxID=34765 RepID=A0ABN7RQH9_OIKDI|nr:Oidioi.mRNA.OKI2018_I69.PAR.g8864.t2.cds [Oikopleura dioica]
MLIATVCLLTGILFFLKDSKLKKLLLQDKVVVITGGTQGLGLAIAKECVKRKAKVVLISRRTIDPLSEEGLKDGCVESLSADVTNPSDLEKAFSTIISNSEFGKIDVLIASAGLSRSARTEDLPFQQIQSQIDVNTLGVMNAVRAALPILKSQNTNSRIAIISSVAGQIGLWGMSAYCASKFALRGFADALGMELEGSNTAVTIIYPPDMNTPGLATENLTKPEAISALADEVEPDSIVPGIVNAVENGQTDHSIGIDGWFATRVTAGLGPTNSFLNLFFEVFFGGVMRLIALVYRKVIRYTINKCERELEKKSRLLQ